MGRKNKNGRKKHTIEKVLLATALIQLVSAIIDMIEKLTE